MKVADQNDQVKLLKLSVFMSICLAALFLPRMRTSLAILIEFSIRKYVPVCGLCGFCLRLVVHHVTLFLKKL